MKKEILNYIKKDPKGVSFAELRSHIEGFYGWYALGWHQKNIVFWFHMSKDAAEAIIELLDEGIIEMLPTEPLTYIIDGRMPSAPIAKQLNRTYKEKRWYPTVLNLKQASPEEKDRALPFC